MKKLQNNFTTPEQSKRLLALGFPADSADCYIDMERFGNSIRYIREPFDYETIHGQSFFEYYDLVFIPCWSAGRLIEILGTCAGMERVDFEKLARTEGTWPDRLIRLIEDLAKYDKLDFSELEE